MSAADTLAFLRYVHAPAIDARLPGRVVISAKMPPGTKPTYKSRSYSLDRLDDAADAAQRISTSELNGYCRVHLMARDLDRDSERGGKLDTRWITHFAADVDIAGPGHKPPDDDHPLPPDIATAVALIDDTLPPSAIISSGGGLYPIWRLVEPVEVDDDNRETIRLLGKRLDQALASHGWHVDSTLVDLARVIRPPGVTNHKPGRDPRPVTVLRGYVDGVGDYTLADIDAAVPMIEEPKPTTKPTSTRPPSTASDGSAPWEILDELYDVDDILAADPVDQWERVRDQADGSGHMVPAWRRVGSDADYSIKAGSQGAVIVWSSTVASRLGIKPGGGVSRWQLISAFAGRDPREAARWSR